MSFKLPHDFFSILVVAIYRKHGKYRSGSGKKNQIMVVNINLHIRIRVRQDVKRTNNDERSMSILNSIRVLKKGL